jgi:hypothetical protein
VTVSPPEVFMADGSGAIGDLAGRAMAVTVAVENDGDEALALNETVVTADYGREEAPASPIVNDPRNAWLNGTLESGESAKGVYVFGLSGTQSEPTRVVIMVSIAGGEPLVAFEGTA